MTFAAATVTTGYAATRDEIRGQESDDRRAVDERRARHEREREADRKRRDRLRNQRLLLWLLRAAVHRLLQRLNQRLIRD